MEKTGEKNEEVSNLVEEGVCKYKGEHYLCKKDGIYPVPSSPGCERKFVLCSHGNASFMACEDGTVFNPQVRICDWPSNVKECRGLGEEWSFNHRGIEDDKNGESEFPLRIKAQRLKSGRVRFPSLAAEP